jgi:hypothetical protein
MSAVAVTPPNVIVVPDTVPAHEYTVAPLDTAYISAKLVAEIGAIDGKKPIRATDSTTTGVPTVIVVPVTEPATTVGKLVVGSVYKNRKMFELGSDLNATRVLVIAAPVNQLTAVPHVTPATP